MEEFESFVKESLKITFRWQVQETSIFVLKLQNSQIMAQLQGDQNGENFIVDVTSQNAIPRSKEKMTLTNI